MTTEVALHGFLARHRDALNASFAETRRAAPQLEQGALFAHLRGAVAPSLDAVAAGAPERVDAVGWALWDASLRLFAAGQLGDGGPFPAVQRAFVEVLPAAPRLLAAAPSGFVAAVLHGAATLSARSSEVASRWLTTLPRIYAAPDLPTFRDAGFVLAWMAGLASARSRALELLAAFPDELAAALLGVRVDAALHGRIEALRASPWTRPNVPLTTPRLTFIGSIAGFLGFGGPFLVPPRVSLGVDHTLLASDGHRTLAIDADAFGVELTPIVPDPAEAPPPGPASEVALFGGRIVAGGQVLDVRGFGPITSAAEREGTLAFTSAHSHLVHLVALVPHDG